MIDTRFSSGLTLLTTAELVGMNGNALPACFTPLPVVTAGTVESLRDAWVYVDKPPELLIDSSCPGCGNAAGASPPCGKDE